MLPRVHPVRVAADSVDLAVVAEEPERLREVPRGKRVGAVPLVHEGEAAHHPGVREIREERFDLVGQQEALVDHRPAGEAGDVEERPLRQVRIADGFFHHFPDHVELALEMRGVREALAAADERLADHRLRAPRDFSQHLVSDGHVAPAQEDLSLALHHVLEERRAFLSLAGIAREKHQSRPVLLFARQADPGRAGALHEERVGELEQNARAVTGPRVGPGRAAVREVDENAEGPVHDVVRLFRVQVADEAHAAGVVFPGRMVQALRGRLSFVCRDGLVRSHESAHYTSTEPGFSSAFFV
ncbi:MAG: hypothetical protein BWY59_01103 [Verrucomicrobia bacterium ADurb.Bin345]|nr:MAG: hypothetical protein BWY59_01103 [Verrucomicrobia bacterium ADurb.Bin345]